MGGGGVHRQNHGGAYSPKRLILAAAAAARGQAEPPPQLKQVWRYQRWGLGRPVDEMSARVMRVMQVLDNVHSAVRAFTAARNVAELAKANPDGWRIMAWLRLMEENPDG